MMAWGGMDSLCLSLSLPKIKVFSADFHAGPSSVATTTSRNSVP